MSFFSLSFIFRDSPFPPALTRSGVIKTISRIDYETIKQISFNAYVTDAGVPQLTSTAEIIVDVINLNDNGPVFSLPDYRFTVDENSPKGTLVGKVDAKDGDDGKCCIYVCQNIIACTLYT